MGAFGGPARFLDSAGRCRYHLDAKDGTIDGKSDETTRRVCTWMRSIPCPVLCRYKEQSIELSGSLGSAGILGSQLHLNAANPASAVKRLSLGRLILAKS